MTTAMTRRQRKAFAQKPDEDVYAFLARTHRKLHQRDLPQLMMLRNSDRSQVEAIQLLVSIRAVRWAKLAAFMSVGSVAVVLVLH